MNLLQRLLFCLTMLLAGLATNGSQAVESVTIRVALYPYVPGQHSVFALIAREFQRRNEGLILEMVDVPTEPGYYDGSLRTLNADVYEIDSILLSDMIDKISPLGVSLQDFAPEAVDAVTRNGVVYALPHWMCGNFLFYRKGDAAIRDAVTWEEVTKELARQKRPLVFDLFGRLTLGEWYITMLADRLGVRAAQAAVLASDVADPNAIADLNSILSACPTGLCRSKDLHDRTGYYAREFMRGEAGAYLGYSETLHYALQESIDNCRLGTSCLSPNEIAVRRLPKTSGTSFGEGIGWVDGLAISNTLTPEKRAAALKFIAFATSADAYALVLKPGWMEAPRYLLPARTGLAFGSDVPLYPDLLSAHAGRKTGTSPGLNEKLHKLAGTINCALPIDRTDTKSSTDCKRQ